MATCDSLHRISAHVVNKLITYGTAQKIDGWVSMCIVFGFLFVKVSKKALERFYERFSSSQEVKYRWASIKAVSIRAPWVTAAGNKNI